MKKLITAALTAALIAATGIIAAGPVAAADPPTPLKQPERHARCSSGPVAYSTGLGRAEGARIRCTSRHTAYVVVSCRYWDVWSWRWQYTQRNDVARAPFEARAMCPTRWDRTGYSFRVWSW